MSQLRDFLPDGAEPWVRDLLSAFQIQFRLSGNRKSKFGDFQIISKHGRNQLFVSVNRSLNPSSFLLTTLHEIAHAIAFCKYGRHIHPHGKEWKSTFRKLLETALYKQLFPSEIAELVSTHKDNPKASTSSDLKLFRALRHYNNPEQSEILLEDLDPGACFNTENQRTFQLEKINRSRGLCLEITSGNRYYIHRLTPVTIVENYPQNQD